MKSIYQLLILIITISSFSSCVSFRKFEDLERAKSSLDIKYSEAQDKLAANKKEIADLKERLVNLEEQNTTLTSDLTRSKEQYATLDATNRDLLDRYDRMLSQSEKVLNESSSEKANLTQQLALKQNELDRRERDLQKLEAAIAEKEKDTEQLSKDLEQLQKDLEAREKRVQELESAIAEKDAKLKALRDKVNQALLDFSASDLTVREENGKVYVSLSQNLLFKSGSKTINSEGKNAIRKLGAVLKGNPDIAVMVEGHTDTDGDENFNWDLSVGRATSVVKELTGAGVAPQKLTAAGRGEFFPVASNDTAEGKAQNRRTEIILTPNLDALYEIINN